MYTVQKLDSSHMSPPLVGFLASYRCCSSDLPTQSETNSACKWLNSTHPARNIWQKKPV